MKLTSWFQLCLDWSHQKCVSNVIFSAVVALWLVQLQNYRFFWILICFDFEMALMLWLSKKPKRISKYSIGISFAARFSINGVMENEWKLSFKTLSEVKLLKQWISIWRCSVVSNIFKHSSNSNSVKLTNRSSIQRNKVLLNDKYYCYYYFWLIIFLALDSVQKSFLVYDSGCQNWNASFNACDTLMKYM